MQVEKQQLELDMIQWTSLKLETEYIMQHARLDEAQAGIKGDISTTSDMQILPLLWQKVKRN